MTEMDSSPSFSSIYMTMTTLRRDYKPKHRNHEKI